MRRRSRHGLSARRIARLQLGQLVVFQFDQALQLVQLALQVLHAAFKLGIFTTTGIQTLLGRRQFIAQILCVAGSAFTRCFSRLRRDQAQVIASSGLCRRERCCFTPRRIDLLRLRSSTATVAPVSILRGHLRHCLGVGQLSTLRRIGQTQHLAGFQAVDVAIDEGVRVERLNRQHGLLDGAAVTRLGSDFP